MSRLDDALADIAQRVAQRRTAGDYPRDLELRLATHAARSTTSSSNDPAALRQALEAVASARRFDPRRIPTTSRSRLGEVAHRATARIVARQISGTLAQVDEFAARVEAALRLLAERSESPGPGALMGAQLDVALDQMALAVQPLDDRAALADLRARIEDLESAGGAPAVPWWDPVRWVEDLDGPFEQVVALRTTLAARLVGPVLDVSVRRGELLWALNERSVEATGAEADARLAAIAAGAGLAVTHQGPMLTLARADDGSLGAVVALGMIGRLGPQGAADLVALANDKLRFGGQLVIEAPDPAGGAAGADPLAGGPVPAEWISFATRQVRFRSVRVEPSSEAPGGARPGCYLVTATK